MIIFRKIKTIHLLVFLFLISIFFILKFSDLVTPEFLPDFIRYIFEKPDKNTSLFETLRIAENLSLAFIAAFIFFIMIEYFPKKQLEKKSFRIVENYLIKIYMNMSLMIDPLKMILDIQKETNQITKADLEDICLCKPEFDEIYYRSDIYVNNIGNNGSGEGVFRFHKDLSMYSSNIELEINSVFKLPIITNSKEELIEILSNIFSSGFIESCKNLSSNPLRGVEYEICDFDISLFDFIKLYEKLGKYNFRRFSYKYYRLSDSEAKEMRIKQEEALRQISLPNANITNHGIEIKD